NDRARRRDSAVGPALRWPTRTWVMGGGRVGLYAGFCRRPAETGRRAVIHLGLPSPTGSSGLPAGSDGPSSDACAGTTSRWCPLGLAPGGVYRAIPVTRDAGGLLHHPFTLTAAAAPRRRSAFCGTFPRVTPGCC